MRHFRILLSWTLFLQHSRLGSEIFQKARLRTRRRSKAGIRMLRILADASDRSLWRDGS